MNNRKRGHNWEREVITDLSQSLGIVKFQPGVKDYQVASTRFVSKALDDKKIDIWLDPKLPISKLNIQCKSQQVRSLSAVDITALLDIKEEGTSILLIKATKRTEGAPKTIGKFAVLKYKDFLDICTVLNNTQEKKL